MDPIQRALDTVFPPEPVKPFEEIDHTSYLEWAGFHTTHTWDGYTGSDLYSFDRRGQLIDLAGGEALSWLAEEQEKLNPTAENKGGEHYE